MNWKNIGLACLALMGSLVQAQTLRSPGGQLEMDFTLREGGVPSYELTYKGLNQKFFHNVLVNAPEAEA